MVFLQVGRVLACLHTQTFSVPSSMEEKGSSGVPLTLPYAQIVRRTHGEVTPVVSRSFAKTSQGTPTIVELAGRFVATGLFAVMASV